MTRARIAALALVNWKGVFYERYLLDRHVTALEGANGAGKTTVMIAAYVVLLPDMSRLRFTNLGESGATGGDRGIWGRLGEPGRPSYVALDLDLAGERTVLGVRLTRAAEPTLEATTFVIDKLPQAVRLSELLLTRRDDGDHVPELDEIKAAVARCGGTIEVFRSLKDYFTLLFDRGITPLRLSQEEERSKWNDLLRTSMTGGISRALTSELRGFVLKEETGLGDMLSRMRANLEACRRTRVEVFEARQLEREISAIYEVGRAMFAAAVHAARAADQEARERLANAARVRQDAELRLAELSQDGHASNERERLHSQRSAEVRAQIAQLTAAGERGQAAVTVAERLERWTGELAALQAELEAAEFAQRQTEAARGAAKQERARALEAYDRASVGLAHVQRGLDELSRRAHALRELQRSLGEARALLERPDLSVGDAPAARAALETDRARCESERALLERDTRDLSVRRSEHARALAALSQLSAAADAEAAVASQLSAAGGAEAADAGALLPSAEATTEPDAAPQPQPADHHARARSLLAQLAERERALAEPERLETAWHEAERLASRQATVRALAESLALPAIEAAVVLDELQRVERTVLEAEAASQQAASAHFAQSTSATLRAELAGLDERAARFQLASAAAARLVFDQPLPTTQEESLELRDRVTERQLALQARQKTLEAERDALQQLAAELSRGVARLDPELARLCEELGAEALAERFEDVEVSDAGWVEARLGSLVHALVVDDPAAAAEALSKLEHSRAEVLLVKAGTALELSPPSAANEQRVVVCEEPFGLRLTRVTERPSLGRRARERELSELHGAIERYAALLDQLAADARQLASQRRDADLLVTHCAALRGGDPAAERVRIEAELARVEEAAATERARVQSARAELLRWRPRLDGLRRLLPDAPLLDPPDYAERARELNRTRLQLMAARAQHARLAEPRAVLSELLDVLRHPPPDDAALVGLTQQRAALDLQRERLFCARAALEDVASHAHAEAFGDARALDAALDAEAALAPALEAQHQSARAAVQAADARELDASAAWEVATASLQTSSARRAALVAQCERAQGELAELGGLPSAVEREHRAQARHEADAELAQLEQALRQSVAERALVEERTSHAERAVSAASSRSAAISGDAEPIFAAWSELRAATEANGSLQTALASDRVEQHGSVQLGAEASSKRELLLDRLAHARGGEELAQALREHAPSGLGYAKAWQDVCEWLRRRVPAQVAELDDPLLALLRLRDHLSVLEGRLQRQEGDLRGSSEDVARGIDVQLRRAQAQVRRLNQQLEGIRFGSIHGIRIDMRRIERMEQILRALRAGEAQELLFSSALPIEEALDEIFRRFGGAGRSGGLRLLDYREYVELAVEIRRQTAASWEPASPTRLSTGEAIGVGAALMMVVLTEWERASTLLRPRAKLGSLRCLFLDEANRLSRDNLGVLFDLCRSLDLQLLVAAPEVARAEGNTTYRLVRHVTDDGREEVIVSGRRAVAVGESEAQSEPPEALDVAEPAEAAELNDFRTETADGA